MSELPNIVLVHDAWMDGSRWGVAVKALQDEGHDVTARRFPETSLADDVARVRHLVAPKPTLGGADQAATTTLEAAPA